MWGFHKTDAKLKAAAAARRNEREQQQHRNKPPRRKPHRSSDDDSTCFCTSCGKKGVIGGVCECGSKLGKAISPRHVKSPTRAATSARLMKKGTRSGVKVRIKSITPLSQHPNEPIEIHGVGFGGKVGEVVKCEWIGFREELTATGRVIDDTRIDTRIPRKAVSSQTYDVIVHAPLGATRKFGYTVG